MLPQERRTSQTSEFKVSIRNNKHQFKMKETILCCTVKLLKHILLTMSDQHNDITDASYWSEHDTFLSNAPTPTECPLSGCARGQFAEHASEKVTPRFVFHAMQCLSKVSVEPVWILSPLTRITVVFPRSNENSLAAVIFKLRVSKFTFFDTSL